jgi:hypothetical protein
MQVTAFSTAARPEWRWRICDYGGETIEESHDRFLTIAAAVAQGAERLAHMNAVDRARGGSWRLGNRALRRGRTRIASSVHVAT